MLPATNGGAGEEADGVRAALNRFLGGAGTEVEDGVDIAAGARGGL